MVFAGLTGNRGSAGGKKILQRVAGKDASKQFWKYHNEGVLKKYQKQLLVGSLDTKPKPAPAPTPAPKKEAPKPKPAAAAAAPAEEAEPLEPFGEQIPFADPNWYQGVSTIIHFVFFFPSPTRGGIKKKKKKNREPQVAE